MCVELGHIQNRIFNNQEVVLLRQVIYVLASTTRLLEMRACTAGQAILAA